MIKLTKGDLLKQDDVEAIVNPVNCVGVMGKGIAFLFKQKWPSNFSEYAMACKLKGRFGVGLVRGYQSRWVGPFKVKDAVGAVGPWNKNDAADLANREYFAEWVDIVVRALTEDTFSHHGKYWQLPPAGLRNPHVHEVYLRQPFQRRRSRTTLAPRRERFTR